MGERMPPPTAPFEVAGIIADEHRCNGCHTLRRWRGEWLHWEGSHWADVEDSQVRAWVYKRLAGATYVSTDGDTKPWNPNKAKVSDVLDGLRAHLHLREGVDTPSWLNSHTINPHEVVACANGLLHVASRSIGALTPYFFNRVHVPFDYQPDAPRPKRWLAFLEELWGPDAESIATLQEFFGYVLSGRTDMQKILFIQGPKRSGKGTIARVLKELVGRGNFAAPTADSLASTFGLSPLLGKPVAVVPDARIGGPNVRVIIERLLSISGEDTLTVDRKYRDPWTGKLPTRLIMMSNDLPTLTDASAAVIDRFVVLILRRSFLGQEDTRLIDALLTELPGILLWALDGLDRIAGRANFTVPESSAEATVALHALASPVSAFVRDKCTLGDYEVPKEALYKAWCDWCEENGHHRTSMPTFAKNLHSVVPAVRATRPRAIPDWPPPAPGERLHAYAGITLSHLVRPRSGSGQSKNGHNTAGGQGWSGQSGQFPNYAHEKRKPPKPPTQTMRNTPDRADHPDTCPHGMPDGDQPLDLLHGDPRCERCRSEENR